MNRSYRRIGILAALAIASTSIVAFALPHDSKSVGWEPDMLIQVRVQDVDASIEFYTKTLGWELDERWDDGTWARIVTPTGTILGLGLAQDDSGTGSGTMSLNCSVADIEHAREVLESRGVAFDGPTVTVPHVVKLATITDADGIRIRLAEDID